jgi:ADP-ribosylglycohydrolase
MPDFRDRARAAFLGLALGDAYGRPLEFVRGESVRTAPVPLERGRFRWTDDTHMSLYLGDALVRTLDGGGFAPERFGPAVGESFIAWLHDPLTPSTAPGNTCLEGVRRYERTRDWRSSGIAGSDGCGAVMRIVPLPIALSGSDLTSAAGISASITHRHPNAIEAAVAASHLVRWLLEGAPLDEVMVRRAIRELAGSWSSGGEVARSLEEALRATGRKGNWLPEEEIWPGDGGWRSGSALGLALAAAFRWGGDFATAIDRAARIEGDSDSVACLAGMLLGAAGGEAVLPAEWLELLPERERIERLAARLAEAAA